MVWRNKGDSLADLGRREEAVTSYEEALTIDPQDAAAWNNKGITLPSWGTRRKLASATTVPWTSTRTSQGHGFPTRGTDSPTCIS